MTTQSKRTASGTRRTRSIPMVQGTANPFADLGLPDADLHLAKAVPARTIGQVIHRREWTQAFGAETVGLSASDMSDICRGKLAKFSLERLEETLLRLGVDIEIRLHPSVRGETRGIRRVILTGA